MMLQMSEHETISDMLRRADKKVTLKSGHQAVIIETVRGFGDSFEGTLIYVPGVHANELEF